VIVVPSPLFSATLQISEYNGAAVVAMSGKECVAIGCDLRLGIQNQTLATDFKKVYKIHERCVLPLHPPFLRVRSIRRRSKAIASC